MAFCAGFVAVLSWNVGNKILTPLNGMLFINVMPLTSVTASGYISPPPARATHGGGTLGRPRHHPPAITPPDVIIGSLRG
jgi:hypothetical protein